MKNNIKFIVVLLIVVIGQLSYAQSDVRLMRFPHLHNDKVVFSYAGDLYLTNITGGLARRITSSVGDEIFPKFSPDGKYIAFTGQYDGNTEVYIIPSEGGTPKRLTYTATLDRDDVAERMGPNNIVMAWTPDSRNIIFRSRCKTFNAFRGQLFSISIDGGLPEAVPIQDGGWCSFSADGKKMAFNNIFREFRTWKYYKGGMADDIWTYDFDTQKAKRLFSNKSQDIFPMWYKNTIYFASDRNRIMNLYAFDLSTNTTTQLTNFDTYDVKFPSISGDKIIFENAGYLYYINVSSKQVKKIPVSISNDFASTRNKIVDASKNISSVNISPEGDYLLLSGRGDIFEVPAEKGVTKNLTKSPGVHERNAVWSPDGKFIAYLSDKTGEFEVYYRKADGTGDETQLTKNAETYKYELQWSPDSKKILWADRLMRLRYVNIDTKTIVEVDKSDSWEIRDFSWSPDSKWITYSIQNDNSTRMIKIFNLIDKKTHDITRGWYSSYSPKFSSDGKYLSFISLRTFSPRYSSLDWKTTYVDMQKIYLVLLSKETENPLAVTNSSATKNEEKLNNENVVVKIDIDNIKNRIIELPIRASYYNSLNVINQNVYYNEYNSSLHKSTTYVYNLDDKKETKLGEDIGFIISLSKNKTLIINKNKYAIIDLPTTNIDLGSLKYADISNMTYLTDYSKEYKQIFDETWRQMRDFFYDPGMHGVDWKAIHDKYAILLPYVKHRNDLTYIMGEMIGELNIGHAYVHGGDSPDIKKIYLGLLGANLSKDKSGYFKIDKILSGKSWDNGVNSPLAQPGLNIKEGEFIIAVNGTETKTVKNIYELLVNTANKPTELTINSSASVSGVRNVVVVPLKSEADLNYYRWVEKNLAYVSEKTNGEVGYIHIPDMSSRGMNKFVEYFYPQFKKKALIIDDRGNGGGNVSPIITEILRREIAMQRMNRNVANSGVTPDKTHVGPKVLLLDEYSASDGDLFPYQFKTYKLGTIIGKRSWGGVIGIRGSLPFIDGGQLTRPEFGAYSRDGKNWIIEGYGVDPDIEIDNNPADEFKGIDAQLDKAIEVISEQMKTYNYQIKPHPEFPDKSEQ